MPTRFNLPHIDISGRMTRRNFVAPDRDLSGGGTPRDRTTHGQRLRQELIAAYDQSDGARTVDDRLDIEEGAFLEVEIVRGTPVDALERKSINIETGATRSEANENKSVVLFVPDAARELFDQIITDYATGPLTASGKPQRQSSVQPIEAIREATFESYWTDSIERLPATPHESIWWEVWCVEDGEEELERMAASLNLRTGSRDQRLYFPEAVVIPVFGPRTAIELMLFARFTITELRRVSDTPHFYVNLSRADQADWANALAERIYWPGENAPAVCLLDTGVNRAHSLIEPALSPTDQLAVNMDWGTADSHPFHGTEMSGIALHGDLTISIGDTAERWLTHRLESVKIIPPNGFDPTLPQFYGAVTQSAVALSEITRPDRQRAFCLAITNDGVSGRQPTTWSSAIDQAASGRMIGDEDTPRRLFFISAGNTPNDIQIDRIGQARNSPIEDPAQSWNAITVGGYTDKVEISEPELAGYTPYATAGGPSPYTRTSLPWNTKSPVKPEIVMEAGNRAISPAGRDVVSCPSLSLLTTGPDTDANPLVQFEATSAATAAASRLAARLMADHPTLWPESIRALIIHSAEWTEQMRLEIENANGLRNAALLRRHFGYGVPDYDRATASATNHLALLAQQNIQPYSRARRKFEDCHFYTLPWPREILEGLGDQNVELKVTLSYFVEPNPGVSASMEPYRYQSHGLRFELRRRGETQQNFIKRINKFEQRDRFDRPTDPGDNGNWTFGPESISAGSVHCDIWTGPAAYLATRNMLCVKPIGGWWRNRAAASIRERQTRYSLVLTVKTENIETNLHTPIQQMVTNDIAVETPFVVQP